MSVKYGVLVASVANSDMKTSSISDNIIAYLLRVLSAFSFAGRIFYKRRN
jgi:hypothetical protein